MHREEGLSRWASFKALKEELPNLGEFRSNYRENRAAGLSRTAAFKDALHPLGHNLLQTMAALAINRITAATIGVGAWDPTLEGPNRLLKDASPFARAVSAGLAAVIPSRYANVAIGMEWTLSAVRIWVEQKAFERVGITGDPAGPILTPYAAGVLDFAVKALELPKYMEMDEASRLQRAISGIYGNSIRMLEAGVIILLAKHTTVLDVFKAPDVHS